MQLSSSPSKLRVAALSLLFTYLFFFEYLPPFSYVHIPYDLGGYHLSLFQRVVQSLRHGAFPEWDPTIYSGIGLASNIQAELFYPPAWLLFAVNVGRSQMSFASLEIFLIAHVWLAFLLCYAWLRGRRLEPLACVLAAGAYAFGGYACLQLQHLGLMAGYAWFPLACLGIDEAARLRSVRPLWKVVAASALCLLAGYPPTWMVLMVSVAVYALATFSPRIIIATAISLVISVAVCAVPILPVSESSAYMLREARYGAGIKDLAFYLSYLFPNYYNFGLNVPIYTAPGMEYLYLGAPILVGCGLLFRVRKFRELAPFFAVAVAGLIFITNPYDLVWSAIKHSSLLAEMIRSWYFLAAIPLALVPLAAHGLDDFLKRPARPRAAWITIAALAPLAAWSAWELHHWFTGNNFAYGIQSIYAPSITLLIFAFALHMARSQRAAVMTAAILLLIGIDYKVFGTSKRVNATAGAGESLFSESQFTAVEPEVYAELKAHSEYRILLPGGGPHPLELRQTGLLTPQGFDPFLPEQYRQFLDGKATFKNSREFDIDLARKDVLHLFGVRYLITAEADPAYARLLADPDFRMMGRGTSYYRVFELINATPPFGWENSSGTTRLTHWTPERRGFSVESTAGGRFLFDEQLLPGWQASIDGKPARIERWNLAFQSINVPPGAHDIQFRFRSASLRWGAVVSALTLTVIFFVLFVTRKRV